MLISMLFVSQIIILVVGLAVGYWLLITANGQEDRLKTIGEILGWFVIIATVILLGANFVYSMNVANKLNMQKYCPINNIKQPEQTPVTTEQGPGNLQDQEPTDEEEGEKQPIKDTGKSPSNF